ncbi:MAG: RsmB/NOP family class I SAM-dependent RNA methyltransferase [Alphaproteobacteria bacterium]|nr:RsmB/NOP family class I SAM-dependent RNA methyltransferase [Alphaproteobacteria bacterium]
MAESLKPRQSAVRILTRVLNEGKTVIGAVSEENDFAEYADSDRNFIRLLILTTLRRLGQIDGVLAKLLKRPLPKKQQTVRQILRLGIAQALFLKTPPYAVVNTSVALTKKFHFDGLSGLVNAVLRGFFRMKDPLKGLKNPMINLPEWISESWQKAYGAQKAKEMAEAVLSEPPLDISVPENPEAWARKWKGIVLPTSGVRVPVSAPDLLEGFQESGCWVQNAAAAIPAQLFTDVRGKRVADLCAAPGGKTAQLAHRGAEVVAFDISENRVQRLKENMKRLGLNIEVWIADILSLTEEECFDAVLLDAPCSATGTLARHPEIKYHRSADDVARLAEMQKELLLKAIGLVKKGGEIVFSTCSLDPKEGDEVIQSVLGEAEVVKPQANRLKEFITPFGSLRILPLNGFDGFYACLIRKK